MTDSLSRIYSDTSCTLVVHFILHAFNMKGSSKFVVEFNCVTKWAVDLVYSMIGILRQLPEPRRDRKVSDSSKKGY